MSKAKDTTHLLASLRKLMQKPPGLQETLSAYIIPSEDEHQSEYIAHCDERRAFISGFNGSAGTAVVTNDKALLWTDGRYYEQAGKQLDQNWQLMKSDLPNTPPLEKWLSKNLSKGSKVGVDPKLMSFVTWKPIEKELENNESSLLPVSQNLIDVIWENKPSRPSNPIRTLNASIVGKTICEKYGEVRTEMQEKRAGALVVTALDEIAWFLNMRGSDISYNPVFFAYLIITFDNIVLFVDQNKLLSDFKDHQKRNDVEITICAYSDIYSKLPEIAKSIKGKIWISKNASYYITSLVPKEKRHQEITPLALMKAVKNPVEAEGLIHCHIRDGLAKCRYFAWLEKAINEGEKVDEMSGATKLEEFRSKNERFVDLSFTTISASGPHGSIIHYHPTEETNRAITKDEVYLCDSGAQYIDGTTDITRTIHLGEPTDFQKEAFTRVLKGQITLATTIFPKKIKGQVLDSLARKALWDIGLDYRHGTGHGIGHYLNVHEGPMGIGIRLMPDDPGLQENMFLSNEPGYYHPGEFGIRLEDVVQIIPAKCPNDFAGRGALTFKTITMCPKQTKFIKKELLTEKEIQVLNDYHQQVRETLTPLLMKEKDEITLSWLERETAPL